MSRLMSYLRTCLCLALGLPALAALSDSAQAAAPPNLPRYYLDIQLDTDQHTAQVRQRIVWTNCCPRPTDELIFNAHSHYQLPDKEVGMTSKIFEILRMMPSESIDFEGHALDVRKVRLVGVERAEDAEELGQPRKVAYQPGESTLPPPRPLGSPAQPRELAAGGEELTFHYDEKSDTALVIPLPRPLRQGDTIALDIEFVLKLPNNYGRWGYWNGITFLTNWLPVLAYYDDKGWQPTPYVSWHQPFFNEAGLFTVRLSLPRSQLVACTAEVARDDPLPDGRRRLEFVPCYARDFVQRSLSGVHRSLWRHQNPLLGSAEERALRALYGRKRPPGTGRVQ
jgi:hypothetical protein